MLSTGPCVTLCPPVSPYHCLPSTAPLSLADQIIIPILYILFFCQISDLFPILKKSKFPIFSRFPDLMGTLNIGYMEVLKVIFLYESVHSIIYINCLFPMDIFVCEIRTAKGFSVQYSILYINYTNDTTLKYNCTKILYVNIAHIEVCFRNTFVYHLSLSELSRK